MDKLPRFRRKAKSPAVQIDADHQQMRGSASADYGADNHHQQPPHQHSGSSSSEANNRNSDQHHHQSHQSRKLSTPKSTHTQAGARRSHGNDDDKPPPSRNGLKLPGVGYLNLLKRHTHAKRPWESPPPDELSTSPSPSDLSPSPPLTESTASHDSLRASTGSLQTDYMDPPSDRVGAKKRPAPEMPAFLALSEQDIETKYHDLTWAERDRVSDGMRNQDIDDYDWGTFVQPDPQLRGVMDRYSNIKPWNHNRIRLQVPDGELDYVNASTILMPSPADSSHSPLCFIAMQGPTEPSMSYVWRMIAEQTTSPAVIVQLTNMEESHTLKCHQYFPLADGASWELNEEDVWGDGWKAQLTHQSTDSYADGAFERRKLLLHVRNGEEETEPLVIWHFWYHRWPDFGVPAGVDLNSFFQLMRLSRAHAKTPSPRIIHCSAGIGRTGTFIALEHLIWELNAGAFEESEPDTEDQQPDPIYDTVDKLRSQRRGMVQGELQYKFVYSVIGTLWRKKYGFIDAAASASEDAGEENAGVKTSGEAAYKLDPTATSQDLFADAMEKFDTMEPYNLGQDSAKKLRCL